MSLKAWYPFDGNIDNYGVGNLNLTQITAPAYVSASGKVCNKALSTGAFKWTAAQTASVLNNQAITIAFWIKALNSNSSSTLLFGNNSRRHYALFNYPTMNDLHYSWKRDATSSDVWTSGNSVLNGVFPTNVWTHCCVVYDNPKGYIYINGVLKQEFSGTNPTSSFAYETEVIHNNPNRYLQDYRVYDHALTPREVKQLAQGLVLHYTMNNNNHTNILNESYNFKNTATGVDPTYGFLTKGTDNSTGTSSKDFQSWSNVITATKGAVYTLSFYARSANSTGLTTFLYQNVDGVQISNIVASEQGTNGSSSDGNCRFNLTPQWQRCWVTYTFNGHKNNSYANLTKTLLFRAQPGDNVEIAAPKLEMGSVATSYGLKASEVAEPLKEIDCSGYGNHGTRSATFDYTSNKDTRYSNSTIFTNSKRIRCDTFSTDGWTDLTMAAWVRPRDTANGTDINTIIIGGAYLAIRTSNNCATTYCYGMNPAGYHTGKTALPLNTWSHIAAVWDSKNGVHKIYVNGKEDFSIACTGTASNGGKKDFGRENDSGRPYIGEMSDARIYATALSADDIKTLYESATSFFNNGSMQAYEFSEYPELPKISYSKTGVVKAEDFSEIGYIGGMKTKVLSDGSAWARIHWLDVSNNKTYFTTSEVQFCDKPNRFSKMGLVDHFKSYTIPKGYTKLDYIQSSGTQYIDTNYYWTTELARVVMDAEVTSNSGNQSLFGNEEPYTGGDRYFGIIPHGSNGSYSIYTGKGSVTTVAPGVNKRFTMDLETTSSKTLKAILNGTQISNNTYNGTIKTYNNTSSTHASKGKIYIFSNHNSYSGGAGPTQNIGGMKLYSFKMYDNGVLVRNFIPCQKSDGTIGLYDKVYGNFYTSPTGTFAAGPVSLTAETETGTYEFMLTYPKLSATGFNRWTQTSSPNQSTVIGFKNISASWTQQAHDGIRKNGTQTVYNCDAGSTWYAPIGQTSAWDSSRAIPAADGSATTETELWVRIDNLQKLNKISMLDNNHIQAFDINEL